MKKIIAVLLLTGSSIVMEAADGSSSPAEDNVLRRARAGSAAISGDAIDGLKQQHLREIETLQQEHLAQLQASQEKLTNTRRMIGTVSTERDQLLTKNKELTSTLTAREETLILSRQENDMLVQTLLRVREEKTALETAMEKLKQEAAETAVTHEGVMHELQMAAERAEFALEKQTTELRSIEKEKARLAAELEAQAHDLNDFHEVSAHEIETLTSHSSQLEAHVARLAKELASWEYRFLESQSLNSELQEKRDRLLFQIEILEDEVQKYNEVINHLAFLNTEDDQRKNKLIYALKEENKALRGKKKHGRRHHRTMRLGVPQ